MLTRGILYFHVREYLPYCLLQNDAVKLGRWAAPRLKINCDHVHDRSTIKVDIICFSETLLLPAKIRCLVLQKTTVWIYDDLRNIMWKNKCFLKSSTDDSSVNIREFTNVLVRKAGFIFDRLFAVSERRV
jgi:hypothetical protein